MRYTWLDEYLMAKPAVTQDVQEGWNWRRYKVGDKMFCAVCMERETNKPYYINLKLEPAEGEFLRGQYEDIIPGYYCNKQHWSSIRPEGSVPEDVMRTILDHSYGTGFRALTKKKQKEIEQLNREGANHP